MEKTMKVSHSKQHDKVGPKLGKRLAKVISGATFDVLANNRAVLEKRHKKVRWLTDIYRKHQLQWVNKPGYETK